MASLRIRKLSAESTERLRRRTEPLVCALEARTQPILAEAMGETVESNVSMRSHRSDQAQL